MEDTDLKQYFDLIDSAPTFEIQTALTKGASVLWRGAHRLAAVSISGGADSDIVVDFIEQIKRAKGLDTCSETYYVFLVPAWNFRPRKSISIF